jgi:hypothetical protein
VRLEELDAVCREAARGLLEREGRPLPPALVLPLPQATRVHALPDLPGDEASRREYLARAADDLLRPANASCFGFVAEGEAGDQDVLVLVWSARGHEPRVTAAVLVGTELGEWLEPEPLDHAAFPFLAPLQRAVDAATAS